MTTAQDILTTKYVNVDIKQTVAQLLGALKKGKEHYALVFDGKKYLGVVGKRFLLTSRINPSEMKLSNIVKKRSKSKTQFYVPTLSPDTDLKKICKLMTTADTHVLPVLDKNKVIGVVHAEDAAREISVEYKALACEELASKPITSRPDQDLFSAITTLSREGIDHLPIVDEQNRLMGMVAMSDIIENPNFWQTSAQKISQAASHQGGKKTGYGHGEKTKMSSLPVKNYMSRNPICCCAPETKITDAIKKMSDSNVCSIVLVKYDKPVGIFTIKDILLDYAK